MNIFIFIISIITSLLLINSALQDKFDELTAYKDDKWAWASFKFMIVFMFFGIFMFLFHKKVKEFRKIRYIEKEIKYFEQWQQHQNFFLALTRSCITRRRSPKR